MKSYDEKYYRKHLDKLRWWEVKLGQDLVTRYQIKSVLDLGCGIGSYLEGALDCKLKSLAGIELSYEFSKLYTPYRILRYITERDITKPLELSRFDCVWSFEVAEHLPPEGTDGFIDNLTKLSERMIVLTAAPPGQSGTGHQNCREKLFWISKVEKRGFKFQENKVSETLEIWKKIKIPDYIRTNLMIFNK